MRKPGMGAKWTATAALAAALVCGCGTALASETTGGTTAPDQTTDAAAAETSDDAAVKSDPDQVNGIACQVCHVKQAWTADDEDDSAQTTHGGAASTGTAADAPKGGDAKPTEQPAEQPAGANNTAESRDDADAHAVSLAQLHHDTVGIGCATCHDDPSLEHLHEQATADDRMPRQLRKTTVNNEFCLTCHNTKALVEATEGLEAFTDSEGTTANPHDLPANESHQQLTCTLCHKVHGEGADPTATAVKKCELCHHTGLYTCGDCHEV